MTTLGGIYQTGSVALTNGSAVVPGSGVLWTDIDEGDWLHSGGYIGMVDSVNGGFNQITLKQPWLGPTTALGPVTLTSISNANPAVFTTPAPHGLVANDKITLATSGTLPSGLVEATPYYVIPISSTTFQVSLSVSGAAVNTSTVGTGTHTFTRTGVMYLLSKMSWDRYDPSLTQAKVRELLVELEAIGNFVYVSSGSPDVAIGDEGQYAINPGTLQRWQKTSGVWVALAPVLTKTDPSVALFLYAYCRGL